MREHRRGAVTHATRRQRLACLALFAVALALRLAHLAAVANAPQTRELMLDPRLYDDWAVRIAAGALIGEEPFFQDPLYAYFLGAIYAVVGHRVVVALAVQCVLGALVAPIVFVTSRRHFGIAAATVAGVLAAFYPPAVHFDTMILKTSLGVLLVTLLLAAASRAAARGGPVGWAVCGVLLGAGCLTRGNLLLLVPVFLAWAWRGAGREDGRRDLGRSAAAAGAVLAGCIVLLAPSAVHNRLASGSWILTTANAGQNFFIGNNPSNRTGEYARLPFVDPNPRTEQRDFAREARRRSGLDLGPAATSRFWYGEAWTWMRDHPADWLRLTGLKLRGYWGAYEIPDNLDYNVVRDLSPALRLPWPGFGLVAPLGLLGAGFALRRPGWPRLLVVFVAVYSTSVILFFVFARFRMAMMPAMFPLAGLGAVELVDRLRAVARDRRAWAPALGVSLTLAALFAFVNLPVRGTAGSPRLALARALGLPARGESTATARFNLGVAYARRAGETEDPAELLRLAEVELRAALAEEGRFAEVWVELGKVLARQGRDAEAIELYVRAAELEPRDYRIQHAIGLLARRGGDLARASAAFRRAVELEPRHARSATRLGEVLLELGDSASAAAAFRHALSVDPADRRAAAGLRRALANSPPVNGP